MAHTSGHDSRKMSDAEALMWRLDKDPYLTSTFANVTILDGRPDLAALKARLERALHFVPRLRQRVQTTPANLTPPIWADDPQFDLDYHVRHVALPKPGSMRQLLDFASLVAVDPFERTRPLWQFVFVDGLTKGRTAMIQKLHHTITDGEGGVKLSLQFLDFERHAAAPTAIDPAAFAESDNNAAIGPDMLRDLLAGSLKLPLGMLRQLRDLLADPLNIPAATQHAGESIAAIVSQLGDTDKARSPLWTQRSLKRRIETLPVALDEAKAAAKRLGGTLNTLFITAAAQAAGEYHRDHGAPVDELRTTFAISTRQKGSTGGNAFSIARLLAPTGAMAIEERFTAIHAATTTAREASASANLDQLAGIAASLPTSVVARIARQQSQTVDFATSNVKAAPVALFAGGAQILANYPVGPLAGVAFNITAMSYMNSFDVGVNIDSAAVEHPEALQRAITKAFVALLKR
jgi:diacylglycerol O-acyltransferase / wax synthase